MNRETLSIVLTAALLILSASMLYFDFENPLKDQEVDRIANGSNADTKMEPLNFQGEKNKIRMTDRGIELDTKTVVTNEKIAEGKSVIGLRNNRVYFTDPDGNVNYYEDGSIQQVDLNAQYGAVFGDFDYEGFNIVYADKNADTYIRNLETGSEELLYSDTVEVVKKDADRDGVSESAEIRLRDGSTEVLSPVETKSRADWDSDGYEERMYLKNSKLFTYDTKHGEEALVNATSYAFNGDQVYTAYDGEITRIGLKQEYVDRGEYISDPVEFNSSVELAQMITSAELNSGEIQAKVITPSGNESFQIDDGESGHRFGVSTNTARVRLVFEPGDDSPILESYELLYKEKTGN